MFRPFDSLLRINLRTAGVAAGTATILVVLGCMSIEIGTRKEECCHTTAEGTLVQTGCTTVQEKTTQRVNYPIPYATPPNLEIDSTFDDCTIASQEADHFCVENPNAFSRKVTWKARGLRAGPFPAVPAASPGEKTETAPPPKAY